MRFTVFLVLLVSAARVTGAGLPVEVSGFVAAETRIFTQHPQWPGQHGATASLAIQPEFYRAWQEGRQSLLFTPFARVDEGDARRSHVDIRELTWMKSAETWELRLGVRKLFWGVAESNHLVDIVNQTDLVENLDGEDKLGQPMVNLALVRAWGTIDLFALPGFRERTFPGHRGRFRPRVPVDTGRAEYESAAGDEHVDWAGRYAHTFGVFDVGVYHFWGTSREPRLLARVTPAGGLALVPRYDLIHQTGADIQATTGNWLWKFEALRRTGQSETYGAMVGGFEYTFVGVLATVIDLGVLAEYHLDGRGVHAPTPFDDDLFGGVRLALNDAASSALLAGLIVDRDGRGRSLNIEASRRFGSRWKLDFELRMFADIALGDPLNAIARDDYLQLELARFF